MLAERRAEAVVGQHHGAFRARVTRGQRRGRPGEVLTLDAANGQVSMSLADGQLPAEVLRSALDAAAFTLR